MIETHEHARRVQTVLIIFGFGNDREGWELDGDFTQPVSINKHGFAFLELEAAIRISKSTITSRGGFGGNGFR